MLTKSDPSQHEVLTCFYQPPGVILYWYVLKLAYMNEQNFVNLGAWWAQKMSRAHEKLTAAVEGFLSLGLEESYLWNQWHAQCDAVTRVNPGMLCYGS